jgi:RNA polymerase sigma-70 factor (ECF subfamily)
VSPDTDEDDRALLAAHAAGDRHAFGRLVTRHQERLWAVAVRTLGRPGGGRRRAAGRALSAYRAAGSYRGEARVTTWLHRIVVNACLDRVRRRAVRATVPLPEQERADPATTSPPARPPSRSRRRSPALPVDQRTAIVLVDVQGLPVAEAAAVLGVPTGTVKSRCSRGRARLRLTLGPPAEPTGRSGRPTGPRRSGTARRADAATTPEEDRDRRARSPRPRRARRRAGRRARRRPPALLPGLQRPAGRARRGGRVGDRALAALPPPPLPDGLSARLARALQDERRRELATVTPLRRGRRAGCRPRRRPRCWSWQGGVGWSLLDPSGQGQDAATSAAESTAGGGGEGGSGDTDDSAVPEAAAELAPPVTDWADEASRPAAVSQLLAAAGGAADSAPARPRGDELDRLRDPAALAACLANLPDGDADVLAVDYARWAGVPAVAVVQAVDPRLVRVTVVGSSCSATDPALLGGTVLPRP